jgi:GNAT superfamily N-acetyltransferase
MGEKITVTNVVIRPGAMSDVPFLARMLYQAYHWAPSQTRPSFEDFLASSEAITRFVDGWGRAGDRAVIADVAGRSVGAAWYRQLSANNHGYSFVDESIPCLAIAVSPEWQGHGIGGMLLDALLARAHLDGFAAITLAVEVDNPAVHLYLRHGFRLEVEVNGYYRMRADCH